MDRQYEYLFVGDSHYYGFLSDCAGECVNQLAEERMNNHRRQRAEGRKQIANGLPWLCAMLFALFDSGV
jgi:hypothetical protein